MRRIITDEEDYYDTDSRNLDEERIVIANANGYGGCDVEIRAGIMRWKDVDLLKEAIKRAEESWREK